ncbi:hypothetical protein RDI58_022097 [Solanum bulbocastanum]|uniref:Reverse transcriptase domain-containing protein n=1 Tax=Solanum bulbocastanum TaxID=147425 RepID=A0AAN8T1F5_SOLBU
MLDEIKNIMYCFQPLKAPGWDGLHPLFYQKCWEIVGDSTNRLYIEYFEKCKIPTEINETHICLIPKTENANRLKDFRPISLCNATYKIITKIIAKRLQLLMDKLIGPCQSSFLKNRQETDNAIIIQELITHFKKMKGKKINLILKLDLEKAFDKIE